MHPEFCVVCWRKLIQIIIIIIIIIMDYKI